MKDPRVKHPVSDSDEEEAGASATAASACASNPQPADPDAEQVGQPSDSEKDMTLEVWWGARRFTTIRWGRHELMWRLMLALSGLCRVQQHHIILRTQRHIFAGVGSILGSDTPHTMSLLDGDTINMHFLPNHNLITTHDIPTFTVAERILKISGFKVQKRPRRSRGRHSVRRNIGYKSSNLTLTKLTSASTQTELRKTSIRSSQNTSKNKRKTRKPVRIGEIRRRRNPLTPPHSKRGWSSVSHRITRVTEPYLDLSDETSQRSKLKNCDDKIQEIFQYNSSVWEIRQKGPDETKDKTSIFGT